MDATRVEYDAGAVLGSVGDLAPDAVILPLRDDGVVSLIQRIREVSRGSVRVLIAGELGPLMERSVSSGAVGRITWNYTVSDVSLAVVGALGRANDNESGQSPCLARAPQLSVREREVLVLAAKGLTNASIARAISLSESTIKTYWRRIFKKLDVHDRTNAVASAIARGAIVSPLSGVH
ncbi:helix-turn-helix transcriptional regulator [Nocardiopsis xinjiangensis]|uniref:helix-turn-helix transcriptional regulator n=1 Tax=Nocardiopsis xinjiangensis TaxID=124285 RepID=UPI00037B6CB5|nr:LuxR C-terminal-related transcriptional regulator [Nocardiopsis xinjiangensis]